MALHLHRAERTDLLADGLGALLANQLPDPFVEELVLVPARGVERWLSQRLSHVLGADRGDDGGCEMVTYTTGPPLSCEGQQQSAFRRFESKPNRCEGVRAYGYGDRGVALLVVNHYFPV
jgi:hypothetical protein